MRMKYEEITKGLAFAKFLEKNETDHFNSFETVFSDGYIFPMEPCVAMGFLLNNEQEFHNVPNESLFNKIQEVNDLLLSLKPVLPFLVALTQSSWEFRFQVRNFDEFIETHGTPLMENIKQSRFDYIVTGDWFFVDNGDDEAKFASIRVVGAESVSSFFKAS